MLNVLTQNYHYLKIDDISNTDTNIKCVLSKQVVRSYLNVINLILPAVKDHATYLYFVGR